MIRTVVMAVIPILLAVIPVSFGREQRDGGENINRQVVAEKKEQLIESQQVKPAVWPQPFQPSEEVGADSEVSFPTDI